jgi:hypothetical protein
MKHFRSEIFFETVPLEILSHDMNSFNFSQESRSFLIPMAKKYLPNDELNFFVACFLPLI